jgi:hypothetical protein
MGIPHNIRKNQIFYFKLIVKAQFHPIYFKIIVHLFKDQIVEVYNKYLTQEKTSKKYFQIIS